MDFLLRKKQGKTSKRQNSPTQESEIFKAKISEFLSPEIRDKVEQNYLNLNIPFHQKILLEVTPRLIESASLKDLLHFSCCIMKVRKNEDHSSQIEDIHQEVSKQVGERTSLTGAELKVLVQYLRNCSSSSYGCPIQPLKLVEILGKEIRAVNPQNSIIKPRHELAQDAELLLLDSSSMGDGPGDLTEKIKLVKRLRESILGYLQQDLTQQPYHATGLTLSDLAELFQFFSLENIDIYDQLLAEIRSKLEAFESSLGLKQLLILANYGGLTSGIEQKILQKVQESYTIEAEKQGQQISVQNELNSARKNKMLMSLRQVVVLSQLELQPDFRIGQNQRPELYKPSQKLLDYLGIQGNKPDSKSEFAPQKLKPTKRSLSELKIEAILKENRIEYEPDFSLNGLFQLDFFIKCARPGPGAQPERKIALEVNGQYHLNSNGIFHLNEDRQLLRTFALDDQGSLCSVNGVSKLKDSILNLKTTRKYRYLLSQGIEVACLDSKLLHEASVQEVTEKLIKFLKL